MIRALLLLLNLTVLGWVVAEVWLQVRQFRQGGPAKRTEWRSLGVIALSIFAGTLLANAARRNLPELLIPVSPVVTLAVALPIAWAGIAFRLWSIHSLGRFFRPVVHVQETHVVVQSGPYRVLRHPSYAGALLALLGFGIAYRSLVSLVALFGCCLCGVLYRIWVEERVLRAELGSAYDDYAKRTRRLIPGVW